MSVAPRLETERLILRAHKPADLPACAAMWADANVVRHIGGRPFTPEEVWSRLLRYAGLWAWLGYGYWAVENKATGEFVGELGFADFKRDIDPPQHGVPEAGWVLATGFHGQGYATEAVREVLKWGDLHLPSRTTVCIIDPGNLASIRVARKCGYQERDLTFYKADPVIRFHRHADTAVE